LNVYINNSLKCLRK